MPTADDPRDPSAPRAAPRFDLIARRSDETDDFDDDLDDDELDEDELDSDEADGDIPARSADLDSDDLDGDELDGDDLDGDDLDDDFPLGDGVADTAAEVWCPYCGEPGEIVVDPGGGSLQRYVEDCPVCCRPWQVTVHFASDGTVTVACEADDASLDELD